MLKRLAGIVLPISIVLGIIFSYLYYQEIKKNQILIETTEEVGHIQVQLRTISENFKDIVSDLLFLSEQHELKALLDGKKDFSVEGLANDYVSFSLRSGIYDQLRFIGTDGMELIRVNYNDGNPLYVPKDALQNKSDRYYFKNSIKLGRGEIYVSPLDLNIEEGKIEIPLKPMIRFAMPVFDSSGKKQGVIAINFLGSVLIKHLRDESRTALGEVSLLNAGGYWLLAPDLKHEWGFMFKGKEDVRFSNMFPEAWKRISGEESGQFYTTEGLFTFGTIHPLEEVESAVTAIISASRKLTAIKDKDEYVWKTVSRISPSKIDATKRGIAKRYLFLFITTTLVVATLLRLYYGISYYRDVAEGIIEESEELFRALSEAASEGVLIVDGFTIIDCNKRLADMLGYEKKELIGKKIWDFVVPDFHDLITQRIKSGFDDNYEGVAITKDGTKLPFEAHGRTFRYKGKSTRVGAVRDISERKKIEQEMRLNSQIISSMREGVHLIDTKGNILYTNQRFNEMFGYEPGELIGKHVSVLNVTKENAPEEIAAVIIKTLDERGSWSGEVENIKKDGTRFWANSSVTSFEHSEHGNVWLTVKTDITKRKESEILLARSGANLKKAEQIANIGNWEWDIPKNEVTWSNQIYRIFGFEPGEITPNYKDFFDRIHPDDKGKLQNSIDQALKENAPYDIEYRAFRKDGKEIVIHSQGELVMDENNKPLELFGTSQDITERKKTEQALELMALFAEQNPAPVFRCDADGILQLANRTAMELLDIDNLNGSAITEILPGIDLAQIRNCIKESSVSTVMLKLKGKDFQFTIRGSRESGIANIYGADISELMKAEAELNSSHERFLTLTDSLDAIVYVADMKTYEILYANKYLSETFGTVRGDICWKSMQLNQDGPCEYCTNSKLLVDGEPGDVYVSEYRNSRNGNWYHSRDRAIRWIDGRIVRLEIATDITHLKKIEETLTKAKEEAEEATRIKDKFVSLVSHDLRAPIGTILGFLNILRSGEHIPLPDDVAKIIDASIDSGENMVKLIEDVLSASRLKTGKILPNFNFIDLYGLVLKSIVNNEAMAKQKEIELINEVPINSRIYVDTTLMYEVFQNLISNAIKFCGKGDSIKFSIPNGERNMLSIADTGKGISPENLKNLFSYEIKTTTIGTKGEKGTGLGLPLANDIVKAHGGTLEVESVLGKGSEFRVKVPYARPTLLYVDDEKFARDLYRLVLKNLDVTIIEAENGVQALEELAKMKPDLLITDINMPEMDGFELIEIIRRDSALDSVAIIALTSDDSIETRDKCFRLGANDFSSKEVSAADFIPRVRRFIG